MSMAEKLEQHLEPNRDDMRRHLEFHFGDAREYDDGQIEIAVDRITGGWFSQLFSVYDMDDAVAFAATQNARHYNVYVGQALRDPDAPPFGRASDAEHYATTAAYVDLDASDAAAAAPQRTKACQPHLAVCTGRVPHTRIQLHWRLEEPITDKALHRELCEGLADSLGGDRSVTNPGRVLRLAGSIAWPTKPGRVPEMTFLMNLKNVPGPVSPDEIKRHFPRAANATTIDTGKNTPIERQATDPLDLGGGVVTDGREAYMRDTILAVLIEFIGQNGAVPSQQELFDAAWPQYQARVDFSRPGRGADEMARKIASTLRRFELGRLRGLPDIDAALARYKEKQRDERPQLPARDAPVQTEHPAAGRFQWITKAHAAQPVLSANWLVKHVLPAEGLGVIFGRPGSGKTFTVMDIAMHVAAGLAWRGKKVNRAAVSYVSPEAGRLGVNRVIGWSRHNGVQWPEGFRLSPAAINLCSSADDADALIADIRQNQPDCRLVVIDTLNRAMAGGDENSGEDMGRFVNLCDRIAHQLKAFVLVVHHSGKDAAKGSRGHSSLLGAVSLELEVTKEQGEPGTIRVTKMRDGEDGAEYGFNIDSVPLGVDEDGEEVTTGISVLADVEEVRASKAAEPKGRNQLLVADAFSQFVDDHGRPNPIGTGFAEPGRVRVVEVDQFIEFVAGKMVGGKPHEKRKTAREAIHGLTSKGYLCVNGGLIWRSK